MKQKLNQPKDFPKTGDSISTDHSTSDQDFHSKESLSVTVQTMFGSRDGEEMSELNNGTLMRSPRPSRTTTGSHTHSTSKVMEIAATSDAQQPTQDGGRCSTTTR
jgi:hypothetical protein